jgi:hypothetical protein
LKKRTSINSHFRIHKEKEMAEFRKLLYALAVVTLLAGLSAPAYAQPGVTTCTASAVPPIVRAEGFTELVGDLVLYCTGGNPTGKGEVVPQVNITILLSTNITSKLLGPALGSGGRFNEALLIIDEPNTAPLNRPLLACGENGAPDTGNAGPGVCSIFSTGDPSLTYDGTPQGWASTAFDAVSVACAGTDDPVPPATPVLGANGVPNVNTFGCGRPNVFQGRTGTQQNPGQFNSVLWPFVPFDPPGQEWVRVLRFTNIRADAEFTGVSSTFATSQIVMNIAINGTTPVTIDDPQQIVAYVQRGLLAIAVTGRFDFVQCVPEGNSLPAGDGTISFREGFPSSFKTRGWEQMQANSTNPIVAGQRLYIAGQTNYPPDTGGSRIRQNVPGAIYNTESGFVATPGAGWDDPLFQNPPEGLGPLPVGIANQTINDDYGTDYDIDLAGSATQGTRLAVTFQNIAAGSQIFLPGTVFLTNQITNDVTGVAVRTATTSNGSGAFSPTGTAAVDSTLLAVYEILYANPGALEQLTIPIDLRYAPDLAQNRPDPTVTTQVAGGFAPFYDPGTGPRSPQLTSSTFGPIPRFIPGQTPQDLFRISKCACNLLFPYVTNASAGTSAFDTGIALANTSLQPPTSFGFNQVAQAGAVQFFYFNTATGAAPVPTQCTSTASPGTCPGTTNIKAGEVLTYVLSQGSATYGLDNRAAGFTGYIIAQAQFQYCHAFAYISAQGAGPLTPGMSVGYLALTLDKGADLQRTVQTLDDGLVH